MSRSLRCRPSELYRLTGLPAYALDSAVVRWGTALEEALQEASNGAKDGQAGARAQQRVLRRWVPSGAAQYRDPAQR